MSPPCYYLLTGYNQTLLQAIQWLKGQWIPLLAVKLTNYLHLSDINIRNREHINTCSCVTIFIKQPWIIYSPQANFLIQYIRKCLCLCLYSMFQEWRKKRSCPVPEDYAQKLSQNDLYHGFCEQLELYNKEFYLIEWKFY